MKALVEEADRLVRESRWEELCSHAARIHEQSPGSYLSLYYLGVAQHRLGKLDIAEAFYLKALEATDMDARLWAQLGLLYLDQKMPRDAEWCLEQSLSISGSDPDIWFRFGLSKLQLKNISDAEAVLAKCLEIDPHHTEGLKALNECRQCVNNSSVAQPEPSDVPKQTPEVRPVASPPQDRVDEARRLIQSNSWAQLLEFARQWGSSAPHDHHATYFQGLALHHLGQTVEALAILRQLLARNPDDSCFWTLLGDIHLRLNEGDQSLSAYKRAVELEPNGLDAWTALARVFLEGRHYRSAEAVVRKAFQLAPSDSDTRRLLVTALKGRVEQRLKADEMDLAWSLVEEIGSLDPSAREDLLKNTTLQAFSEQIASADLSACRTGGRLHVRQSGSALKIGNTFAASFVRTLRIPEDGKEYPLPPGFGYFPLHRVGDYATKVPREWSQTGGYFLPMYQREAMWLHLPVQKWRPCIAKVGVGQINAVTGYKWDRKLRLHKQDYVVCPDQPWLDGINSGEGVVRQFIAMPLGLGYTIEAQLTDEEHFGGIQIVAFEPREGLFLPENPESPAKQLPVASVLAEISDYPKPLPDTGARFMPGMRLMPDVQYRPAETRPVSQPVAPGVQEMGIAAGGRIRQQIFADKYGTDTWDAGRFGILNIRILNSEAYEHITGHKPPPTAIDAQTYAASGLPWYAYYEEKKPAVAPAKALAQIKSVRAVDLQRGMDRQEASPEVQHIEDGLARALSAKAAGEYEKVIEHATELLASQPDLAAALNARADAFARTGRHIQAAVDLQRVLHSVPKSPLAIRLYRDVMTTLVSEHDFASLSAKVSSLDLLKCIAVGTSLTDGSTDMTLLDAAMDLVCKRVPTEALPSPAIRPATEAIVTREVAAHLRELTLKANRAKDWRLSANIALALCELAPLYAPSFFTAAMAYFSLERYQEAKIIQLLGPTDQWKTTIPHHSMACIELRLSNAEEAMKYARSAIRVEPSIKDTLLKDPDLQPIWDRIKTEA